MGWLLLDNSQWPFCFTSANFDFALAVVLDAALVFGLSVALEHAVVAIAASTASAATGCCYCCIR